MAKNIYFEAGNQPVAGKVAVSLVVLNRVEHHAYPDNVCDVIYQAQMRENWKGNLVPVRNRCQFSWFCDGKSDEPVDSATWMFSLATASMGRAFRFYRWCLTIMQQVNHIGQNHLTRQ